MTTATRAHSRVRRATVSWYPPIRAMRLLRPYPLIALTVALGTSAAGCNHAQPNADDEASADAGSEANDPGLERGSALFSDAAMLDCPSLAERWYKAIDVFAEGRRGCATNKDCIIVSTDVVCAASDGSNQIQFTGCGGAIASRAKRDYEAERVVLEELLCAADPLPSCVASSLCPSDIMAHCANETCQVR